MDFSSVAAARAAMKKAANEARLVVKDYSIPAAERRARMDELERIVSAARDHIDACAKSAIFRGQGAAENGVQIKTATGTIGAQPPMRLSQEVIQKAFEAFKGGDSLTARATLKTSGIGLDGDLPAEIYGGAPMPLRLEPFRVSSLFPSSAADSPNIEVLKHGSTVGSAGPIAEATEKPEVSFDITKSILPVVKLAVQTTTSTESLGDLAQFGSFLQIELLHTLAEAENNLILNGSTASGATMTGILAQAGLSRQASTSENGFDTLARAFTDLRNGSAFCDPSFVLMHPSTFDVLRRTKDNYGRYLLEEVGPSSTAPQSIWGVPVHTTTQIGVGQVLTGNAALGCQVFFREGVMVRTNAGEKFSSNQVIFLAEERLLAFSPYADALNVLTGVGAEAWAATTAYSVNDLIIESGDVLKCTTAGVSGSTAPTAPATVGATVTDGTVVWTRTS